MMTLSEMETIPADFNPRLACRDCRRETLLSDCEMVMDIMSDEYEPQCACGASLQHAQIVEAGGPA